MGNLMVGVFSLLVGVVLWTYMRVSELCGRVAARFNQRQANYVVATRGTRSR